MDNKPDGYYGPEESMRPDSSGPKKEEEQVDDKYFDLKTSSNREHHKRCIAIQRRGTQQRLQFAISKLEMIADPFDSEKETLATARKALQTLETAMRRSGQVP